MTGKHEETADPLKVVQVDAFTDQPFKGNPAAVCLLDAPRPESWMQAVAQEMNLSETAFLHPVGERYALRWFTPSVEVDLCGHATLASAHVLWEGGRREGDPIEFETRSGVLRATRSDDWIELDFPATPAEEASCNIDLERALGAAPLFIGKSIYDFIADLPSEQIVRDLTPDIALIERAAARGVIATARAAPGSKYDFVSRFFAPQSGVAEDPVTGSAHCCLAPYWARRLGKDSLVGYQASPRGGTVRVRTNKDRVILGGQAVTVLDAVLR